MNEWESVCEEQGRAREGESACVCVVASVRVMEVRFAHSSFSRTLSLPFVLAASLSKPDAPLDLSSPNRQFEASWTKFFDCSYIVTL